MTFPRLICAAAIVLISAGVAAAKPGVATSTVNLRADPNTASDVLAKIPAGGRVDVGECNDGWCAINYGGKSGYSIQSSFDTSGRAPPRRTTRRAPPPGGGYDDDDDVVQGSAPPGYVRVPPPGGYADPEPYYRPYYRPYWGPYFGPRWGW